MHLYDVERHLYFVNSNKSIPHSRALQRFEQRKFNTQNFHITDIQDLFIDLSIKHSSYTTYHTSFIIHHHSSHTTHHTLLINALNTPLITHSACTTHPLVLLAFVLIALAPVFFHLPYLQLVDVVAGAALCEALCEAPCADFVAGSKIGMYEMCVFQ